MAAAYEPRSSLRSSQQASSSSTHPHRTHQHRASTAASRSGAGAANNEDDDDDHTNLNPLSSQDALPSTDFGFDKLRARMGAFSTRFDDFVTHGRQDVLRARNAHRTTLSSLADERDGTGRAVGALQAAGAAHARTLQREAAETAEMKAAVAQLGARRDGTAAANEAAAREADELRRLVAGREAAQREYAGRMAAQARLNAPELAFYEEHLGLRIESPADDEIAFVFVCVDDRDPEREFEVVLDLSRRDYAIKVCRPKLEPEKVQPALDRLNEGRDLAPFLKDVRRLFQNKSREERG